MFIEDELKKDIKKNVYNDFFDILSELEKNKNVFQDMLNYIKQNDNNIKKIFNFYYK